MEKDLERKQIETATFGYEKGFVATKEQIKRADVPVKAPDPVVVNPLKFVEDAVEQNDNSFDGIINNAPQVPNSEMVSASPAESRTEEAKKSVLEQLQSSQQSASQGSPKPKCHVCEEDERVR